MTKDELKKLSEDLDKEEKGLRDQLNKIANKNPAVLNDYQARMPDYGDHDDENAREVTDWDRNMAIERELEEKLRDILATKEKIKNGTYGKCQNCLKAISKERLKVKPVAALCIDCAKTPKVL